LPRPHPGRLTLRAARRARARDPGSPPDARAWTPVAAPGRRPGVRAATVTSGRAAASAGLRGVEPAAEGVPAGQRELPVCGDPVPDAQLADNAERVARAWALALSREGVGARLDDPPARIQSGEGEALLVGRDIQRVRSGAAQGIRRRGGSFRPGAPAARQLLSEVLGVAGQPAPGALDPLPRGARVHSEG